VVGNEYNMQQTFGQIEDGELPGTIALSVPNEGTAVDGAFRAWVKQ
jgi:hypothetical protein